MQMLELYFQRCGTPAAGSPVGLAMIELIKMDRTIPLEDARATVNSVGMSSGMGPKAVANEARARLTKVAA
jgi:hypothetical protein